jgi:bifunctional DNA-binding transcriptional regulator/antitoxin component of YhaV-PrlF toxin-antitoxin module
MSTTITMDAEGRLTLPAVFRDQLSLKGGAKFKADLTEGKIELTPEAEEPIRLIRKGGLMVITGIKGPVDAVAAIQADREAREDSLSGSIRQT